MSRWVIMVLSSLVVVALAWWLGAPDGGSLGDLPEPAVPMGAPRERDDDGAVIATPIPSLPADHRPASGR